MDGATLSKAMLGSLSLSRYNDLAPAFTQALQQAGCTTLNRAAMFCAQIGHESAGLKYMEEIASGEAYEGRRDLGNTQKGDGKRFKGRGPIQITGRHNYTAVSKWAHGKGYVPTATYFVDNPGQMSSIKYGFLGAVWYWTVARNMNGYADKGDIVGATKAVNGGTNGLADRRNRWNVCKGLGQVIVPGKAKPPATTTTVPIYPTKGKIHTPWGKRGSYWSYDRDKNGNGIHTGDDWHDGPNSTGNPIYAVADGTVIYAGNGKDGLGWGPAFGNQVLIQWSDRGRTSIDAHMSRTAVKYNQRVKAGDIIGYLGQTGNVTGPHDHHEQHLGTGWGDKRVKPIYPGRQTTTTPAPTSGGILGMSTHYYKRRSKDFTHKKGGWRQIAISNDAKSWTIAQERQLLAINAVLTMTGLPAGKEAQVRFIEIDYKKGKPNIIAKRHPWIEIIGSNGQSSGQIVFTGKVGWSSKARKKQGYQRRMRLQMNVFNDVEVVDLRIQGLKG